MAEKSSSDLGSCRLGLGVAFCDAMSTRIAWLRFISVLLLLVQDAVRFLLPGTRSNAALKAENLFLRKQLALYLERKAKLRRADDRTVPAKPAAPAAELICGRPRGLEEA